VEPVVTFTDVGIRLPRKRRRKGAGRRSRIRRFAGEVQRDEVWRVRNFTAEIQPGESVALVGMRGAGQQALLRLAAGTLIPDEGTVHRKEPIIPMIEVAKALSRGLSVRQNIYYLGGLYGMSRDEMDEKLPGIVEFAGLKNSLDRYLMNAPFVVRQKLAWSVAMSTQARAFAIDQILVVGERAFRQECWTRVDQLREDGVTFLINSDSAKQYRRFCDRAWYLTEGGLAADTTVPAALDLLRAARQSNAEAGDA
jgi:ABC-2 type transport system ATP-binding protein